MKRLGSIALVGVAVLCALAFGAERLGVQPPSGLALPKLDVPGGATPATLTVGTAYFDGAGEDTSVLVGDGGSVRLSAGYGLRFVGLDRTVPAVHLERRIAGGAWQRTGATVSVPDGLAMTVMTPAFATSRVREAVEYRLVSGASASRAMTVVYEDQRRYTGMARTIYGYLERYCPSSAVHVEALDGREAGDYRTGALLIRIDSSVGRSTVLRAIDQRALALHECSHERQWLDYGSDAAGRTRMLAAAKRWFSVPGNAIAPVEHAADCGAQALNPGGYLGYGGTCSAVALREGRRLLLGGRY